MMDAAIIRNPFFFFRVHHHRREDFQFSFIFLFLSRRWKFPSVISGSTRGCLFFYSLPFGRCHVLVRNFWLPRPSLCRRQLGEPHASEMRKRRTGDCQRAAGAISRGENLAIVRSPIHAFGVIPHEVEWADGWAGAISNWLREDWLGQEQVFIYRYMALGIKTLRTLLRRSSISLSFLFLVELLQMDRHFLSFFLRDDPSPCARRVASPSPDGWSGTRKEESAVGGRVPRRGR